MPSTDTWEQLGDRIDARLPVKLGPTPTELCKYYMTARFYAGDDMAMQWGTSVIGGFDMGLLTIQGGYIQTTPKGYARVLKEDGKL